MSKQSEGKNFAEGIYFKPPHPNAPEFVLGKISIKVDVAVKWLQENVSETGYVNMDAKLSKSGKYYVEKDDWQPGGRVQNKGHPGTLSDDIPF